MPSRSMPSIALVMSFTRGYTPLAMYFLIYLYTIYTGFRSGEYAGRYSSRMSPPYVSIVPMSARDLWYDVLSTTSRVLPYFSRMLRTKSIMHSVLPRS